MMGLLTCLAGPSREAAVDDIKESLSAAKLEANELRFQLSKLQADREQLLDRLRKAQSKQDASTEMPSLSVAVQATPPVSLESRIPQLAVDEPCNVTNSVQAKPEASLRSRIPIHPGSLSAKAEDNKAAAKAKFSASETTCTADLIQAVKCTACLSQEHSTGCCEQLKALPTNVAETTSQVVDLEQRMLLLQQQLKVAEAFRTSLEAQLRDARFANSNLQTQVLNLQTKFERTVEEQVEELEKINNMRKEGQERFEAVMSELAECKKQHFINPTASQLAAYKTEASAAVKRAVDSELKLSQTTLKLKQAQEELVTVKAQLNSTEQLVAHMADKAKTTAEHHDQEIQKLENELRSQKAIYDSVVEEMLQLSNNYNDLKQKYHNLQSETKNHDEIVQLVQQELAELSYYAAAGRVALGAAPMSCTRGPSTEVSSQLDAVGVSDGSDTYVSSLKLVSLLSTESTKSAALTALLSSRGAADQPVLSERAPAFVTQTADNEDDQTSATPEASPST